MRELIEKQAAIDAHCELCVDRNKYFCNSDICPDVEVFQLIPSVQTDHIADADKKGDLISRLSEIRSQYNCFDESEEPYYRALTEVIEVIKSVMSVMSDMRGDLNTRERLDASSQKGGKNNDRIQSIWTRMGM